MMGMGAFPLWGTEYGGGRHLSGACPRRNLKGVCSKSALASTGFRLFIVRVRKKPCARNNRGSRQLNKAFGFGSLTHQYAGASDL
jgi:hypothetical protein